LSQQATLYHQQQPAPEFAPPQVPAAPLQNWVPLDWVNGAATPSHLIPWFDLHPPAGLMPDPSTKEKKKNKDRTDLSEDPTMDDEAHLPYTRKDKLDDPALPPRAQPAAF